MNNFVSTYRLQLNSEFTLKNLEQLLPYLQQLGVGAVYASPVFEAVPGSGHGYDCTNPNRINPEIGTVEELEAIGRRLRAEGILWLQDIVPNHMAFHSRNEWLMDVLEKGPHSPYASYFDISWDNPLHDGRLMAPFLGSSLEEAIDKGQLRVERKGARLVFTYFEAFFPLQPLSYARILQAAEGSMPKALEDLLSHMEQVESTHSSQMGSRLEARSGAGSALHRDAGMESLAAILTDPGDNILTSWEDLLADPLVSDYVDNAVEQANGNKELLLEIEAEQFYRLCHWQETDYRINYRRFFTVNGLICLNIQDKAVMEKHHELLMSLVANGTIHGLRIDHIDGLADPTQYLHRLRQAVGEEVPLLVEKILEPGESLPQDWPVQGNTGYDFLALVNNLFTHKQSEKAFSRFYRNLVKDPRSLQHQITSKKTWILNNNMAGELDNLYQMFRTSGIVDKRVFASIRPDDIKEAIGEFMVHCPVYRLYGSAFPLPGEEEARVRGILKDVRYFNSDIGRAVELLEYVLLQQPHEGKEEINRKTAAFYRRCMQFSGPLMAKGVEDTLMYTNNRFAGHNEVGDSPDAFGITAGEFHQAMAARKQHWPLSLNATSTHDTKRGEDVRARLNVLTDLGEVWLEAVKSWMEVNAALKTGVVPDANDEYLVYQTIIGALPMKGRQADDFPARLGAYVRKALREAKRHTNWTTPDEAYEKATIGFATSLLAEDRSWPEKITQLLPLVTDHGIVNSLSQLVLKFTCPGVPDVYRGCELWDLSLVDPDNRRPVDFDKRKKGLDELENEPDPAGLWEQRKNGKIKLWLTSSLFGMRRQHAALFKKGDYLPLTVEGAYSGHILAFMRKHRQQLVLVAVPLHTAILSREQGKDVLEIDWKDTSVRLPGGLSSEWTHALTGGQRNFQKHIPVAGLLGKNAGGLPFAILKGQQLGNERGAGILLHISSLPSPFGIGDMGQEAYQFADFLQRSRQKYWQLLPLNPTEAGQGHSPYSSISSMAGNGLFISPELLAKDGLLASDELREFWLPKESKVNFAKAEKHKELLFERAWRNFNKVKKHPLTRDFEAFCEKEQSWLGDFALYALLKQQHGGTPWYQWEDRLKLRENDILEKVKKDHREALVRISWLQFLFARQWRRLKDYCNELGIRLIGDLPIYVSYDSADVWSHRHLFALDEKGDRTGMAGVPPDAFSADGQLWGMPVFNWEALKAGGYRWWIERLRKNIELFDLVRLDHFRAFSAYWEVPAGETTAKNGRWVQAPGQELFTAVQKEFGELPFVAEDLGEIDPPVYELRDSFRLPGMKVLQFAFGGDMPRSDHIPHNYKENFLVYTGTHDNNTSRGWFSNEGGSESRKALERYVGRAVSAEEVASVLARMAYASVASIAILPMQDVLNLDEQARMNTPASGENNWGWRMAPGQLTAATEEMLGGWTVLFNRE